MMGVVVVAAALPLMAGLQVPGAAGLCKEQPMSVLSCVKEWQELVSGLLAVGAALVTIIWLRRQLSETRRQVVASERQAGVAIADLLHRRAIGVQKLFNLLDQVTSNLDRLAVPDMLRRLLKDAREGKQASRMLHIYRQEVSALSGRFAELKALSDEAMLRTDTQQKVLQVISSIETLLAEMRHAFALLEAAAERDADTLDDDRWEDFLAEVDQLVEELHVEEVACSVAMAMERAEMQIQMDAVMQPIDARPGRSARALSP
jgi:hypothetical protein